MNTILHDTKNVSNACVGDRRITDAVVNGSGANRKTKQHLERSSCGLSLSREHSTPDRCSIYPERCWNLELFLDRLLVLKKAQKELITQRQAATELDMTERHIRRLLSELKEQGDQAVIHGLRGRTSNRKLSDEVRERIVRIVSQQYADFGPTQAREYLANKHKVQIGREALRQVMIAAGLWR